MTTQQTPGVDTPGATLEGVLVLARRLSPDLAARALTVEAAQARVDIAGSLPDPKLQVMSDEIDRLSGPRQNKMIYGVEQEFPLWGKRDLRRQAAAADVSQMAAQSRDAESQLIERMKVAFALYYTAYEAIRQTESLHRAVHSIAQTARDRYALGRGSQQEVLKADVENTRVATEVVRLEAALKGAQGQLNALLARPLDAPLARPQRLRPLPDARALDIARLVDRALASNPGLAADAAVISGAEANRRLAERSWYPDVTIGAAAIDRTGNGPNGYQAWISAKVPLQWGLHAAQTREAAAQAGVARLQRDAREQQIRGDLAEAAAAYDGSRRRADLIRRQLLPQSEAVLRSGTTEYAFGKTDLAMVLQSEHDLADLRLQLLTADIDVQRQLAAIERLIGGDL
ncbi:TolC family protein [Limobrevibacterium gyesilva]|uniref:TolC family protein n=1 Tax=Limobrevibacterium gyesilva TaxID=2991712 RepID=A0AA42CFB3_9PROT|nr:TolC family protein [Limobrevibacterium gyesilva]MCW3476389.1 TolC family protein [Limobrevibacterium gyesilva]